MKHEDQQFLSDLMDGEWHGLDLRRAVAETCGDEALRAKWSRYHLARHAMQHEPLLPAGSIAERVARAVAEEPTYSNVTALGASPAPMPMPSRRGRRPRPHRARRPPGRPARPPPRRRRARAP